MELQPRLSELTHFLAGTRAELLEAARGAPDTLATGQVWTIPQILQHVALLEVGTTKYLTKVLDGALEAGVGRETDTSSVLASLDAQLLEVPPRLQTPEELVPAANIRMADAVASLGAAREELDAFIAKANGWDGKQVMGDHPFFGTIDLYQYLLFIAHHERRHAAQITRIRAS